MTVHAGARVSLNQPQSPKAAAEDFAERAGVSLSEVIALALAGRRVPRGRRISSPGAGRAAMRRARWPGWKEGRDEGAVGEPSLARRTTHPTACCCRSFWGEVGGLKPALPMCCGGRMKRPKDRKGGRPADGRAIRLAGGVSRRPRGCAACAVGRNRGAPDWAGAERACRGQAGAARFVAGQIGRKQGGA